MIGENRHPKPLIFQYICGCDEPNNSSKNQGSDLGLDEVFSESAKESQNAENCGPKFYLCSSIDHRFSELPTSVGHPAYRSPLGLHWNAMDRKLQAEYQE